MADYDLLVKNGSLFDSSARRFLDRDLAITDGSVARVADNINPKEAAEVLDAKGQLVVPGLVDFHTHFYWAATPLGVNPDKIGPDTGVTTWLDFGSAGAGNIEGLVYHVIRRSTLRLFALLNLSYVGLTPVGKTVARFGELFDQRLMDRPAVVEAFTAYPQILKGIKIRLGALTSGENGSVALRTAKALSRRLGVPLFVHATAPPPFLEEVLGTLEKGDVLTHCLIDNPFNGILGGGRELKEEVRDARDRGVLFDVGHGVSTLSFDVARHAFDEGFWPDVVSSDLHAYNINGPVFDLPTTISKMVALGMPLEEALYRATRAPAEIIGLDRVGALCEGKSADFALMAWRENRGELHDSKGQVLNAPVLRVTATYLDGKRLEPVTDDRREGKWKAGLLPQFKPKDGNS